MTIQPYYIHLFVLKAISGPAINYLAANLNNMKMFCCCLNCRILQFSFHIRIFLYVLHFVLHHICMHLKQVVNSVCFALGLTASPSGHTAHCFPHKN